MKNSSHFTIINVAQRILIIEDEEHTLEILELIFTEAGFSVKTSKNGEDTFDLIQEFNPQFILLDIVLPKLDGRDICKAIKKNPDTKNIPVIILSAHPGKYYASNEVGASDFVQKPFDIYTLVNKVKNHLSGTA
ncbi:response regulator [Rubrolithibacter danxiaensis]|uniref:response regulator n=1 Tax=Rubrolithibacter danxiaensis TaxID=3390805 RepID=UPI003BF8C76D